MVFIQVLRRHLVVHVGTGHCGARSLQQTPLLVSADVANQFSLKGLRNRHTLWFFRLVGVAQTYWRNNIDIAFTSLHRALFSTCPHGSLSNVKAEFSCMKSLSAVSLCNGDVSVIVSSALLGRHEHLRWIIFRLFSSCKNRTDMWPHPAAKTRQTTPERAALLSENVLAHLQ